jgi:hypothetical protein
MIWQDYKKLYWNALKQYSPKFEKELQRQVDTYCNTLDYNAISSKAIKKTIQKLHLALGTKMAGIAYKNVNKSVKSTTGPKEVKSALTDLWSYTILTYLEQKGLEELAEEITDTTKEQIRRFLIQAQEQNLTINETIKLLRVSDLTDYRAALIARTETGRAANVGSVVGAVSTGLVTVKEWIATRDARTRRIPRDQTDHLSMDGVQVPIDETFTVKGIKYIDLMLHPCDSSAHAGNVCNCRCTLGYEAQRDASGNLQKLENNPPKGDVGRIWGIIKNPQQMEVRTLIRSALQ